MALAYVLALVALIALVVGEARLSASTALALAQTGLEAARAEALADGALAATLASFARPETRASATDAGAGPRRLDLPGGRAVVTIEAEAGKVDLNAAPPELLRDLFRAAGADAGLASRLAARVVAVRPRRQGFAGTLLNRDVGAGFVAVDELAGLPGVDGRLADAVAPALTTVSGAATVDPGAAAPLTLTALASLNETRVRRFLADRAALGRRARLASPHGGRTREGGGALTLRLSATTAGGGRFTRVVVVAPDPFAPPLGFRVLEQKAGDGAL